MEIIFANYKIAIIEIYFIIKSNCFNNRFSFIVTTILITTILIILFFKIILLLIL